MLQTLYLHVYDEYQTKLWLSVKNGHENIPTL